MKGGCPGTGHVGITQQYGSAVGRETENYGAWISIGRLSFGSEVAAISRAGTQEAHTRITSYH
jgi:hypothetical protein